MSTTVFAKFWEWFASIPEAVLVVGTIVVVATLAEWYSRSKGNNDDRF